MLRDGTVLAHPSPCPKCGEEKDMRAKLCRVCSLRRDLKEALQIRADRKAEAAAIAAWRVAHPTHRIRQQT